MEEKVLEPLSMQVSGDTSRVDVPKIVFWKRWEAMFGEPKTGTIKYALLNRKETGFHRCVRFINGRIYLDVHETFRFFDSSRELIGSDNG